MSENYWKDAYKDKWDEASKREIRVKKDLEKHTGKKCIKSGLGAGSSEYISGNAASNGHQKGDADFWIQGTNIYVEVTGPLKDTVSSEAPLWFRPDKVENAIKNRDHDVFLVHHCLSADLWRVIHVDTEFKWRYRNNEFKVVEPIIRGRKERYVEVNVNDRCIKYWDYLLNYIKEYKEI